jgi:hypothetical protein
LGAGIDCLTVMNAVSFFVTLERDCVAGDAAAPTTATTPKSATTA